MDLGSFVMFSAALLPTASEALGRKLVCEAFLHAQAHAQSASLRILFYVLNQANRIARNPVRLDSNLDRHVLFT